jgi:hypothetical protein
VASQYIKKSLQEVGYDGYLLIMNGGFPHPRGFEMKYVGVPYCFKIFMIGEAQKLGFERVIWIDSGCYAVNNPNCLFEFLGTRGALFRHFKNDIYSRTFQDTADELDRLTGGNVTQSQFVHSVVFGLNLTNPKIQDWIEEYYEMVKLGTPFLSVYPEEIVFTALFSQEKYREFYSDAHECVMLQIHETYCNVQQAKNNGYFFLHRDYNIYK